MLLTNNTNGNYTMRQLKLPLEIEKWIDISDPVYTFCEVMDHIDLSRYFVEKGYKTDHDATFMRLKRDYMGNDQLLPAYSIPKDADLLRNRKVNTKKRQNRHLPELAFLILGTYFTAPKNQAIFR